MKKQVMKSEEITIVDGPRYECAEMASRFALSWLDRTRSHLKKIKKGRRAYYHQKLIGETDFAIEVLVDLVIKLDSAYGGHALTKNGDLIYMPRFDERSKNVYGRPGHDVPCRSEEAK